MHEKYSKLLWPIRLFKGQIYGWKYRSLNFIKSNCKELKRILIFGNTWDEMGTSHPQWNRAKMSENFVWNYFLSSVWKFREVLSILYANSRLQQGVDILFFQKYGYGSEEQDYELESWRRRRKFMDSLAYIFSFRKNMRDLGYVPEKRWNFGKIMVKLSIFHFADTWIWWDESQVVEAELSDTRPLMRISDVINFN